MAKSEGRLAAQAGFTLTELLVVVAIIGIVVGLSIPNFTRTIDNAKLKAASQQLAAVYQDARLRATHNNTPYQVLMSAPGVTPPTACIDLDGNGVCSAGDPSQVLPAQVSLSNAGVPQLLNTGTVGFTLANTPPAAIVWNGLGIPCQRASAAAACSSLAQGWVQYLQLQRSGGDVLFAAVSVSPTGRVKTWIYSPSANGNGSWF